MGERRVRALSRLVLSAQDRSGSKLLLLCIAVGSHHHIPPSHHSTGTIRCSATSASRTIHHNGRNPKASTRPSIHHGTTAADRISRRPSLSFAPPHRTLLERHAMVVQGGPMCTRRSNDGSVVVVLVRAVFVFVVGVGVLVHLGTVAVHLDFCGDDDDDEDGSGVAGPTPACGHCLRLLFEGTTDNRTGSHLVAEKATLLLLPRSVWVAAIHYWSVSPFSNLYF